PWSGARRAARIHALVQGPCAHEPQTSFDIIDLRRGLSQIKHDAVYLCLASGLHFLKHGSKASMYYLDPWILRPQLVSRLNGERILVKHHQPGARPEP